MTTEHRPTEHRPPHLDTHSLVEAILGSEEADLDGWTRHLSFHCSACWETLRSGVHIRSLRASEDTLSLARSKWKPPEPVSLALNRLTMFHAPVTTGVAKSAVWQPLLSRHRYALKTAQHQPFGFLRLVLEESQLSLSHTIAGNTLTTPMKLAERAIRRIPRSADETILLRDIQAWGQVALARAAHRQGAPGQRVRQIVQEALVLARQGSGDSVLAATLWELRSLPADLEIPEKIEHLDRAIELIPDPAWKELRAEFLAAKAKHQVWWPEQAAETCRQALKLLDAESPCLRIEMLDQLAAVELQLEHREEAKTLWLEAQQLATAMDEDPVTTCERWVQLAHAVSPPLDPPRGTVPDHFADTAGFFRAAIAGYRTLQLEPEENQLLLKLASTFVEHRQAERFAGLEPELVELLPKLLPAAASDIDRLIRAAHGEE